MGEDMAITLDELLSSNSLQELNDQLTSAMAEKAIQAVLKEDDAPLRIARAVMAMPQSSDGRDSLIAAAALMRLAAVTRGERSKSVESLVDGLFGDTAPTSPIDGLPDADTKSYAAQSLAFVSQPWVSDFAIDQALQIDSADNARQSLMENALRRHGDVSVWLVAVGAHTGALTGIENPESQTRRARRVIGAMELTLRAVDDVEVGIEPGNALADCVRRLLPSNVRQIDSSLVNPIFESSLRLLSRVIELRFSYALSAETYALLGQAKRTVGNGPWGRFLDSSEGIRRVRGLLKESVMILARQQRTDKEICNALLASWSSRPQIEAALHKHLASAPDVDSEIAKYWISVGTSIESRRKVEHRIGNSEDEQIGELLIQVDANKAYVDKMDGSTIALVGTLDACSAATLTNVSNGYKQLVGVVHRLAKTRRLEKTSLLGKRVEYNPRVHDMEGGHRSGIRNVVVVRDGIEKKLWRKDRNAGQASRRTD